MCCCKYSMCNSNPRHCIGVANHSSNPSYSSKIEAHLLRLWTTLQPHCRCNRAWNSSQACCLQFGRHIMCCAHAPGAQSACQQEAGITGSDSGACCVSNIIGNAYWLYILAEHLQGQAVTILGQHHTIGGSCSNTHSWLAVAAPHTVHGWVMTTTCVASLAAFCLGPC